MSWQAVASIAKGAKHIEQGKPCQDWGAYKIISEDIIIGAVSDGMGSAKHSEIGSRLAVEVAISELQLQNWQFQPPDEKSAKKVFITILKAVVDSLKTRSNKNGYLLDDLACTLLLFIATPQWIAAMQVGDGLIVVRSQNGDYQLVFKPDKGELANETTSVTSSEVFAKMQVCIKLITCQFICVATDGIENISLIKTKKWEPYNNFFLPLEKHMHSEYSLKQKKEKLSDFLNSKKINRSTNDDKTLLLCVITSDEPTEPDKIDYHL